MTRNRMVQSHLEQHGCSSVPSLKSLFQLLPAYLAQMAFYVKIYLTPILLCHLLAWGCLKLKETEVIYGSSSPKHWFHNVWAGRYIEGLMGLHERWLKVLCQPVNAMNEAHEVALRNFLEGSMSKLLHFRLKNLEYISLGMI